jgi:hypothetical protein
MQFLSTFLLWFKIISVLITVLFLALAVRYIIKTDVFAGYRKYTRDVRRYGGEEKKHVPERWKKEVLVPIQSKNPEKWKQALLSGENMLDDALKSNSFGGLTLAERLERADEERLPNINSLREAHARVFSLVNAGESIPLGDAKELLREYREALKTLGYL